MGKALLQRWLATASRCTLKKKLARFDLVRSGSGTRIVPGNLGLPESQLRRAFWYLERTLGRRPCNTTTNKVRMPRSRFSLEFWDSVFL